MRQKIEAQVKFVEKIENNLIKLLKAIREHTQNYVENCYNMSIVLNAMRKLLNEKQQEGESFQDWTKRFCIARDIMVILMGGTLIMKRIVESMSEFNINDESRVSSFQERTFECFLAYLYLENIDRAKYSSLLMGLNNQQSLVNDQYPKTVTVK
jgi:hypothetical protein